VWLFPQQDCGVPDQVSSDPGTVPSDIDMRRLTTGIRSEKCLVTRFRRCANVYLHKPGQYCIAYCTPGYMV